MQRDGQAEYQRHQVYVPVGVVDEVQKLIDSQKSIDEALKMIRRKSE